MFFKLVIKNDPINDHTITPLFVLWKGFTILTTKVLVPEDQIFYHKLIFSVNCNFILSTLQRLYGEPKLRTEVLNLWVNKT